jgi:hypothetical protein
VTVTIFVIKDSRTALLDREGDGIANGSTKAEATATKDEIPFGGRKSVSVTIFPPARVNAVLLAPEGRRDWPLRFYSRKLLFSKEARLGWVEPDLAALPDR